MLFEISAMITEEVEKVEIANIPIQFYNLKSQCYQGVHVSEGDVYVIINAMADYADILMESIALSGGKMGYKEAFYEIHANRCRKISERLQEQTGYNREEAIERCRKKRRYYGDSEEEDSSDVGEDAMYLAVKQRREKAVKAENEKAGKEKTDE